MNFEDDKHFSNLKLTREVNQISEIVLMKCLHPNLQPTTQKYSTFLVRLRKLYDDSLKRFTDHFNDETSQIINLSLWVESYGMLYGLKP